MQNKKSLTRFASISLALTMLSTTVASAATGTINAGTVRFRQAPSTSSAILETLRRGDRLDIIKTEGEWFQVSIGDVTGFVFGQFVTVNPEPVVAATAATPAAAAASTAATAAAQSPAAPAESTTAGNSSDDANTEYETVEIDDESLNPAEAVIAPTATMMRVTANRLNIRAQANSVSNILGQATLGQELQFLERSGDRAKIKTQDGIEGYVLAEHLSDIRQSVSRGSGGQLDELIAKAMSLKGIRYVWGGMSLNGFDCSGFVGFVFNSIGIRTPRSSFEYAGVGLGVSRENLLPGDVLMWDTDGSRRTNISHVGIYLGNDRFIHSSTSRRGVVVASLSGYRAPFLGARRLLR